MQNNGIAKGLVGWLVSRESPRWLGNFYELSSLEFFKGQLIMSDCFSFSYFCSAKYKLLISCLKVWILNKKPFL